MRPVTVFFHPRQLGHAPRYEWTFGEKVDHPETTTRAQNIFETLSREGAGFVFMEPTVDPLRAIARVHHPGLITLYRSAAALSPGVTLHPSVFPKRSQHPGDPAQLQQAGYFCFDSGTPLTSMTWEAACLSAACAMEATRYVASGAARVAYALCRPPGHHASRDLFGGYCYFNNAAVAAWPLRARGKVAILDIDFHHGNGTQDLFYRDDRVLYVSIHGDPREFYPYFCGHAHETGAGRGLGFTQNHPLPRGCDAQEYLAVLERAVLPTIRAFQPAVLIVSAGFDTFRADPIGAFALDTPDYHAIGARIGRLGIPTVALQEGGYCVEQLGVNVATFLAGLREGLGG